MLFFIFNAIGHLNYGYEKFSKDFVVTLKNSSNRDQAKLSVLKPEEKSNIPSHPISSCMSYFVDNSASS